jgi:hypothetical protein
MEQLLVSENVDRSYFNPRSTDYRSRSKPSIKGVCKQFTPPSDLFYKYSVDKGTTSMIGQLWTRGCCGQKLSETVHLRKNLETLKELVMNENCADTIIPNKTDTQ